MPTKIPIKYLDIVTIYDPARSRESEYKTLANHAVGTYGMDQDYNVFVLEDWAARVSLDLVLEEVERQCNKWNPRCVGVEAVAAQSTVADIVYTYIEMKHNIAPLYTDLIPDTRVNKKWRIRMQLQRVAPYGRLHIQSTQYGLKSELLAFPNGRTIDRVDILAYGIQILNPPILHAKRSIDRFLEARRKDKGLALLEYEDNPNPFGPKIPQPRKPPDESIVIYRRTG